MEYRTWKNIYQDLPNDIIECILTSYLFSKKLQLCLTELKSRFVIAELNAASYSKWVRNFEDPKSLFWHEYYINMPQMQTVAYHNNRFDAFSKYNWERDYNRLNHNRWCMPFHQMIKLETRDISYHRGMYLANSIYSNSKRK